MTGLDRGLTDVDRALDDATASLARANEGVWIEADGGAGLEPPLARRRALVPVRRVMYVTRFGSGPPLRSPLKVELSPTDDMGFDLYSPVLNLGGVGESIDGALKDLGETVLAVWAEYSATPAERLAPDAAGLLHRLRALFLAAE